MSYALQILFDYSIIYGEWTTREIRPTFLEMLEGYWV